MVLVSIFKSCYIYDPSYVVLVVMLSFLIENNKRKEKKLRKNNTGASVLLQKIFGEYTESTAFERPLTSGVAYALKVLHSDRMHFEKQHGWTIKKMETENEALVQDCIPGNLDPAPIQDEYAPVIFAQETVSHIVSIDMMSGKVCSLSLLSS